MRWGLGGRFLRQKFGADPYQRPTFSICAVSRDRQSGERGSDDEIVVTLSGFVPVVSRPGVDLAAEVAELVRERAGGDLEAAGTEEAGERLHEGPLRDVEAGGVAPDPLATVERHGDQPEPRRSEPEEVSDGAPDAGAVEEEEDVRERRQVIYHAVNGRGVRQSAEPLDEDGAGALGAGVENDQSREVVALPEVEAGVERHVQKPRRGE